MAKEKFNFVSPIHLACADDDLRPVMECVHFVNGFIYASDGFIVVKQSLEYSSVGDVEQLKGKSIHRESFKEALSFKFAVATDEGLQCKDENEREAFFYYAKFNSDQKIPDFESVINTPGRKGVDFIGIDPKRIAIAGKILLGAETSGIKFSFNGIDKGMTLEVLEYENQIAYLMPRILEPTLF